jgi:ArsR family transcriptional regulator, lead/cadmium/zinc/bismuth-responsive transcriptional repressor
MCEHMSMRSSIELTLERCETECLHPEQVAPLLDKLLSTFAAEGVASVFDLLADPTRARILHALSLAEELCVCDLALLVGFGQSAVSHQLRLLRASRAVTRRKAGRIVYYRLADEHIRHLLGDALRHAAEEPGSA